MFLGRQLDPFHLMHPGLNSLIIFKFLEWMMPFGSNVAPSWLPSKSFFLEFDDHDAIVNSDGES